MRVISTFSLLFLLKTAILAHSEPLVEQLTFPFDHSEGPTWDIRNNHLYFVDIFQGRIWCYDYQSKNLTNFRLKGAVTPVVPAAGSPDMFLVGQERSVVVAIWDYLNNSVVPQHKLATVSEQFPTSRFNDGKADKDGRLWWGTMGAEDSNGLKPNEGVFYKIEKDEDNYGSSFINVTEILQPVNISNGLAWNKANDKLYYIDTPTRKIVEYHFNDTTGEITFSKIAFDLANYKNITGNPDGMTIDEEDNLWIALYGGWAVIKVNPNTGELLLVIKMPAENITSTMWGGPNLDILYVTSSRVSLSDEDRKKQPQAGSVFSISNLGTKGLPVFNADIVNAADRKSVV